MTHPERVFIRGQLLDRVWGGDYDASPEYLKVFVSRLRAKLRTGHGFEYIETERGRGYRFVRPRELTPVGGASDARIEPSAATTHAVPVGPTPTRFALTMNGV